VNWLAHLRLAPAAPLVRLGNLAGDFVRGVDLATLHEDVRRGVHQHRAVDRFVDGHPIYLRARARVGAPWRRFSGVALDVFFDHFLARDWAELGDGRPLDVFVGEVHEQLVRHRAVLPPALRRAGPHIAARGWLGMYGTLEGVDEVLDAMAKRSPRRRPLADVGAELRRCYDALAADFAAFWPALSDFVERRDADSARRGADESLSRPPAPDMPQP
jgi:acyl carrier protein phosphodiesterase